MPTDSVLAEALREALDDYFIVRQSVDILGATELAEAEQRVIEAAIARSARPERELTEDERDVGQLVFGFWVLQEPEVGGEITLVRGTTEDVKDGAVLLEVALVEVPDAS